MSCISKRYLFWFVKYSHFTHMMCYYLNVQCQDQRVNQNSIGQQMFNPTLSVAVIILTAFIVCVYRQTERRSNFNECLTRIRMRLKTGNGGGGRVAANDTSIRQKINFRSVQKVL